MVKRAVSYSVLAVSVFAGLYLASLYNYLLFHTLAEGFSIIVAYAIFMLAWNARGMMNNNYLLFIGIAYLFVGSIDFAHAMAYKGIGIFDDVDANTATQLWIAARYMESISMAAAFYYINRKLNANAMLALYAALTALILASVFYWKNFPVCFVEGSGLTGFKVVSEYVISLILVFSTALLIKNRGSFDADIVKYLAASMIVMMASELAFTLYISPYGIFNMIGHYLKLVSFYLLYKAIMVTGVMRPRDVIFRELTMVTEEMQSHKKNLEYMVAERTANLTRINEELETEIAERRKLEEELMHARRMESLGRLAGGIAHDFNNRLSAIMNYAFILKMQLSEDSHLRTIAKEIIESVEKAACLTSGLLAFSRKHPIKTEQVKVNEVVGRTARLLSRVMGSDVRFKASYSDESPVVMADEGLIENALMNLANNARDAMPQGGTLTMSTCMMQLGAGEAGSFDLQAPGPYAVIAVSDTGTGMDSNTVERIFEPFFTTKEPGKGTGLGLSMVYGIIKQHGGSVRVDSSPGMGSTFNLYLPAVKPKVSAVYDNTPPEMLYMGRGETILLVEDEVDVMVPLSEMLRGFGYKVMEAANGEEALRKARGHYEALRLFILDIMLPDGSGLDVFRRIKADWPKSRAIFLSGYGGDAFEKIGMDGNAEFLVKPVPPIELLRKVRQMIDRPAADGFTKGN